MSDELKAKINWSCKFNNRPYQIIEGHLRIVEHTNLAYVEPHKVVILKEVESELLNNRDRIRLLLKNNEELNSEIDNLKDNIKSKDEKMNNLKKENSLLK